jgi:outer membrane protein TolC
MRRHYDHCVQWMGRAARPGVVLAFVLCGQFGCRSINEFAPPPPTQDVSNVAANQMKSKVIPAAFADAAKSETPAEPTSIPRPATSYPIDLSTALALAGADNPTIALAQEAVATRQAERLQADALLLPTLHAGADYDGHTGNLENTRGLIRPIDRQSVYVGAGAGAVGTSTVPVPGVRVVAQLADAIYEPRVARQRIAAADFDARATRNLVLGDVAFAYFEMLGAEAALAAIRRSETELQEIVQQTAAFARTGQGRESDAHRAATTALLLRSDAQRGEEDVAVASARLARLLSFDPSTRLQSVGQALQTIELVSNSSSLESLVQIATASRPEIAARSADVMTNETRLSEERVRPFVPFLSAGYSAGGFGGGSDSAPSQLGPLKARGDFDAVAVWTLANFGLGNIAVQKQRRAEVGMAEAERLRVIDLVRREVAEAQADAIGRRQVVDAAGRQLRAAEEGFRLDLTRSKNLEGRPIEVINSASLLLAARLELIRSIVGFNQAQFRLYVALGQPPSISTPPNNTVER